MPNVSILLPVYNGEKYLRAAIESICGQTFKEWELLVLDDGSTDSSVEVARSFRDERIRVFPNGRNLGVARTLNRGITEAKGEWIARMDADDEALPDRLRRQVDFLRAHPKIALLGTNAISAETGRPAFVVPTSHELIRANLLFNCSFLHPTVMWRKEVFERENLSYEETPTAEDYDLWERAVVCLQTANLTDRLLRYRDDPEVKVSAYVRQQKEGGRKIRERALRRLRMNPSSEEMEIHHAVSFDNLPQPAVEMIRVDEWLGKILRANESAGILDSSALRARLHRQRYYHIMRNRPSVTYRQLFIAGGGLGRVPVGLAGRALVRRMTPRRTRRS